MATPQTKEELHEWAERLAAREAEHARLEAEDQRLTENIAARTAALRQLDSEVAACRDELHRLAQRREEEEIRAAEAVTRRNAAWAEYTRLLAVKIDEEVQKKLAQACA